MTHLVKLVGVVFIASFMFSLGLQLTPAMLTEELRRPARLLLGLALSLVLAPLVMVLLLRALGTRGLVAAELLLLAATPGAPMAPLAASRAKGKMSLAIVLHVILGVVTVFTAPPLARWLVNYRGELEIHPAKLVAQVAILQALPLAAGLWVHRRAGARLPRLLRVCNLIGLGTMGLLVVLLVGPSLGHFRDLGWAGLEAIVASAVALSALAILVSGSDRTLARTLASTVALPNIGLAAVLARGANAKPVFLATLVMVFLVRALLNIAWSAGLGRWAGTRRPTTPKLGVPARA